MTLGRLTALAAPARSVAPLRCSTTTARFPAAARLQHLTTQFEPRRSLAMAHAPTPIAIVAGVGPGTGGEVAKRFAKSYPTLVLARTPASYEPLVAEIQAAGGKALAVSTDLTSATAVRDALAAAAKWVGSDAASLQVAAAIYNASGRFVRAPFLELTEEGFTGSFTTGTTAGFIFAQAVLPGLLRYAKALEAAGAHDAAPPALPASLIFSGATASVKGSAQCAAFAAAKHGLRAMSQSLAREFYPQGVHVSHAVLDGVIDIPRTRGYDVPARIDPKAIAESYWNLHAQPRTTWTWEIDLRPWLEKW